VSWLGFLLGSLTYVANVLLGYHILGWGDFPYRQYYPNYFSPYWWEVFLVPVWGLVIAFGFSVPCYYFGKWVGGKATFAQTLAIILLASAVSLPIMLIVDTLRMVYFPGVVADTVIHGVSSWTMADYPSPLIWFIDKTYAYAAMAWQGVASVIGLAVIHKISWWKNLPGLVVGNALLAVFLMSIRDFVALII
jgi:hypothetical protein